MNQFFNYKSILKAIGFIMSKKTTYKDIDKECPVCGGIIWGKGINVLIEGAKITVCRVCAQFGKRIREKISLKRDT